MTDSIHIDSASIVAVRLKEARLRSGLSTRAVAEEIAKRFPQSPLSHATIANYEKPGGASPPVNSIAMLADVYEREVAWFLEKSQPLLGVRYRSLSSRVLVRERHQFETEAQHWLEGYLKIEQRLRKRLNGIHKIEASWRDLSPADLALAVRELWDYRDGDPIKSVVAIMEGFGIRVIELRSAFRIDGLAARFGSEYAVVLNPTSANDRGRMNAAHELGHVLYGDCSGSGATTRAMDDRAFEFACCLLISNENLKTVFSGRSAVLLAQAKESYGISMAAMIYRAEKLKIIDARTTKKLWIQFAKRGWRANEPGTVRPDRAIRLESMLDQAVFDRKLTWSEAAAMMGVSRSDLDERMRVAMGCQGISQDEPEGGSFNLRLHG